MVLPRDRGTVRGAAVRAAARGQAGGRGAATGKAGVRDAPGVKGIAKILKICQKQQTGGDVYAWF